MPKVKISRPDFPEGYLEHPKGLLPWNHVEERLTQALNYWLVTVRPDGRPHAVPKWGVWVGGRLYFDGSPETRHSRNIALNPHVIVHLENGSDVVIVEGEAAAMGKPDPDLAGKIAAEYRRKYADQGYTPEADQWDNGGLTVVTPHKALAWTEFTNDPTKFLLE